MPTVTRALVTVALTLAAAAPAHAFGWGLFRSPTRSSSSSSYSSYYYCPTPVAVVRPAYSYAVAAPVYAVPAAVQPAAVAVVPSIQPSRVYVPQTPLYAQPLPAPPSQGREAPTATGKSGGSRVIEETQEPPLPPNKPARPGQSGGPKVTESQSFFDGPTGAPPNGVRAANHLVQVGFWNTAARTVELAINGRVYQLPGGRSITLHLPRQFTWQMDEGQSHAEAVPAERASLEIVIR